MLATVLSFPSRTGSVSFRAPFILALCYFCSYNPPYLIWPASSSYEEDKEAGTVTTHFKPLGGRNLPHCTSSLLVAADGYSSRVRQQCCGDGPPDYSNTFIWRARVPAATTSFEAAGVDLQGRSSMVMDAGRLWFSYPISSGDVVWTVSATGVWGLWQGLRRRMGNVCGREPDPGSSLCFTLVYCRLVFCHVQPILLPQALHKVARKWVRTLMPWVNVFELNRCAKPPTVIYLSLQLSGQ
jgi:hypothetical protein